MPSQVGRSSAKVAIGETKLSCNCINMTDAALEEHNTELSTVTIMSEQRWSRRIGISTNVLTKQRGARPVRIVAKYCPLCGVSYEDEADALG